MKKFELMGLPYAVDALKPLLTSASPACHPEQRRGISFMQGSALQCPFISWTSQAA